MDNWTLESVPESLEGTAVTIGKFDGVHLGHQQLLSRVVSIAEDEMLTSVCLTFDRHPDALLNPAECKLPLIGPAQKTILLREQGVDATVTLNFDEALAAMLPETFVKEILVDKLKVKVVVVGEGFRFGSHGAGTTETLKVLGSRFGFRVVELSKLLVDGAPISTTRIRELLDLGKVVAASALLGRNHLTTGVIVHGLKIGRTIGFPTANFSRDSEGYLPFDGVYAGWLHVGNETYPAALSVGINETFEAVPRLLEVFVLDHAGLDLYDQTVTAEYVEFIRPAAKFDGVESLVAEINRDLVKIRKVLEIE